MTKKKEEPKPVVTREEHEKAFERMAPRVPVDHSYLSAKPAVLVEVHVIPCTVCGNMVEVGKPCHVDGHRAEKPAEA